MPNVDLKSMPAMFLEIRQKTPIFPMLSNHPTPPFEMLKFHEIRPFWIPKIPPQFDGSGNAKLGFSHMACDDDSDPKRHIDG